jgi:hypothetical protein
MLIFIEIILTPLFYISLLFYTYFFASPLPFLFVPCFYIIRIIAAASFVVFYFGECSKSSTLSLFIFLTYPVHSINALLLTKNIFGAFAVWFLLFLIHSSAESAVLVRIKREKIAGAKEMKLLSLWLSYLYFVLPIYLLICVFMSILATLTL